ncbi:hypothetical protein HDU93_006878, partial [Gonapodya sp. JEL0774]
MPTSNALSALSIRPFLPSDQSPARELVLRGLEARWGTLDPTLNPDLHDISRSFATGYFVVAVLGERVVATGGFIPEPGRAERT